MATASDKDNTTASTVQNQSASTAVVPNGHHGDPVSSTLQLQPPGSHIALATTSYRSRLSSSSDSSSSEDSCPSSDEAILHEAGVNLDLSSVTSVNGHAPLELVSQCVTCLLSDHHAAASLLCQKVMELEPGNTTVQEIYPLLQERLRLDKELPTESSSDSSSSSESSSSEDEATPAHPHLTTGTPSHCHH